MNRSLQKKASFEEGHMIYRNFLSEEIERALNEIKESIETKETNSFEIRWYAMVKEDNGNFTFIYESRKLPDSFDFEAGIERYSSTNIEKVFKIVLEQMGREIKPQLNDQLEFI